MARTWYLVQSKPRNEARALENLLRQGYETYLPLIEVERLQRGKLLKKQEPLFSRYLFLHLEEGNDNWGPIRFDPGRCRDGAVWAGLCGRAGSGN